MTITYLLDTNVVSDAMRPDPHPGLESRVRMRESICAISALTLEEIVFGISRLAASARRDRLESWLADIQDRFVVLPYDARAAVWLGREKARLAAVGRAAAQDDGQIAAIAVTNNLTLITRDRDFGRFEGLRTENWFAR